MLVPLPVRDLQSSVDVSEVRQVFPHGRVAVEVVDGGLRAPPALENGSCMCK
jgi:Conserved hypothetical protein (Lin0512_fam)